jgi:membrane-bound inhibitor of C-type lysozyme
MMAAPAFAQSANADEGIEVVRKPVAEIPAQYRSDAAKPRKPFAIRYTCPESGRLYVVFDHAQQTATIELGQTTRYLRQGVSASGARYVNSDESYVFWVKGQQATINGKEVCDAD